MYRPHTREAKKHLLRSPSPSCPLFFRYLCGRLYVSFMSASPCLVQLLPLIAAAGAGAAAAAAGAAAVDAGAAAVAAATRVCWLAFSG